MYISRFTVSEKDSQRVIKKQSVKDHLFQVAGLAEYFGKKLGIPNFMKLAGLLHDLGKYAEEFQSHINSECERASSPNYKKCKSNIDHGVHGGKYIYEKYSNKGGYERYTAEILLLICSYHHGGLPDCVGDNGYATVINRIEAVEVKQLESITKIFEGEVDINLDELFQNAVNEIQVIFEMINPDKIDDAAFMYSLLIKTAYSMLVDADRLDSMCFEIGEGEWKKYIQDKDSNTKFKKYQANFNGYISSLSDDKSDESKKIINEIRAELSETSFLKGRKPTGIFDMTIPTGGGKTLASMRMGLEHNIKYKKDRIIYVIPFTSIIEQNAEVMRNALGENCDLLEHHSNVLETNKDEEYDLLSTRWDNDVVITTMVQFLNTFYGRGTQDLRRLHNLINATIIFDEIQTLPSKCMNLFNSAINYLSQITNTSIVLCTATQPDLENENLVRIIKTEDSEIVDNLDEVFYKLKRVEIVNECKAERYDLNDMVDYIVCKKSSVKNLLVVLNKVQYAQRVFSKLEGKVGSDIKLVYLSSNLCPQHKRDTLKELKKDLYDGKQLICVSTTVIEAGVDISFDAAIRNLTKLDSIAQTAGRVNRNGENEIGFCYVINYDEGSYVNLEEIEIGGKISRDIMRNYNDLLDPAAMKEYFKKYYSENSIFKKFNYPMKDKVNSIYEWLKHDRKNINGYAGEKSRYPLMFWIQFKRAADNFHVIDNNTRPIIVPYGDGKDIIEEIYDLGPFASIEQKLELLKKAKNYTVNLYPYNWEKLKDISALGSNPWEEFKERNIVTDKNDIGCEILADGYYDERLGVVYEIDVSSLVL